MSDVVDKETRSRMMANITSRNTKPELFVRSELHKLGFRFRKNVKSIKGTPDIVLKKYSALIFTHGCFWHGHNCRYFKLPTTRREFWASKIESNRKRDAVTISALKKAGWRICIVWECAIRSQKRIEHITQIASWITSNRKFKEIRD
jgi:DNA mismatch endonuclease (patch repair protein)